MGLPPIAVEQWGPWVFINPDTSARPIAEAFADLGALLARRNWTGLRFHSSKHWDIACNWKVYVDNYLDGGYHIPHMHPSLDAQLDMSSYRTECFDLYSIQTSGGASTRIGEGAIYAWTYPAFMINVYGDCMDTNRVEPIGPDRCRVYYEFFFADSVPDDVIAASIAQSDITQREDIEICESVQVGLRSPSYDRGRYAPQVEIGEHHFHRLVASTLRAGL
jgi:choline monooxygenase